jgi:hypothetical protein
VSGANLSGIVKTVNSTAPDGAGNVNVSGGVSSIVAGNGIAVSGSGAVTVSQDFYTGTSATNTSFPIGSYILAYDLSNFCNVTNLAQSRTLYVRNSPNTNGVFDSLGGTPTASTALTGTWRSRGQVVGTQGVLWQRTA